MWINDPGIANLMIMHYVSCVLHNKKITCVECCWIVIAISFPSNFIAIWFQHRDGYFFKKHKDQRTKTKTKKQFYRLFLLKIISNCFQPHKNYPRNISVYLVCVSTLCSASVCDMCDCFYRGWHSGNIITWQLPMCPLRLIHWPWVRGLTQKRSLSIKLEVSRRWPEADSFPICKLSVFIYLLLNDLRFKPIGHFFPSVKKRKKRKENNAVIFPADHLSLAHQSQGLGSNFDCKVFSTLEMDAFESLPFNTNKCLCHSCPPPTHISVTSALHTFSRFHSALPPLL